MTPERLAVIRAELADWRQRNGQPHSGSWRLEADELLVALDASEAARERADRTLNELAAEQATIIRKAALKEAADVCRSGTATGGPGWSWRMDCAEEIDELADAPPKAKT